MRDPVRGAGECLSSRGEAAGDEKEDGERDCQRAGAGCDGGVREVHGRGSWSWFVVRGALFVGRYLAPPAMMSPPEPSSPPSLSKTTVSRSASNWGM